MSHFNFERDLGQAMRMDGPLTKGPQIRWERKLNQSCNKSLNESALNMSSAKTPNKIGICGNRSLSTKTPGKSPHRGGLSVSINKTPGKKSPSRGNKTPSKNSGDRFIPNRSATQFDLAHFLLSNSGNDASTEDTEMMSPSKKESLKNLNDQLNGDKLESKILSYKGKAPTAPEGYQNNLKVLYSQTKTPGSCRKISRHIPQVPERILDAPELIDDYYLNLLDWSSNNHLAVCLGGHVYLWNAGSGDIQQLMEMEHQDEYVSSVAWVKEGNYLAIGTSSCEVQLWDVVQQKRLRCMSGHTARVGALDWNSHILSSGSRSGFIHHHDVRVAQHLVSSFNGHSQEVCGLKWSPDGKYLASGGNDNLLNIWQQQAGQLHSGNTPIHTFSQHQAAVKALAWCPWQPSTLASGGGTADRHIRLWNCNTGTSLKSVDTKSQVCSILWSKEYKELVSSHGFAQNQLIIWKYPTMDKVAELTGHTSRVLHMAMSPDGTTVVSAAADETLRLWKCFDVDPLQKKKQHKSTGKAATSILRQGIR